MALSTSRLWTPVCFISWETYRILHRLATIRSLRNRLPSRQRKRLRKNTMKTLLTLLALVFLTLSSRADISEGVKSWLKGQGAVVKSDYHLTPIAIEDIKKSDIIEFDKDGENQYGIVWADSEKDSDVVAVDVGGLSTDMFVLVPIKKTDIKGAVRCVKGGSTFVMPTHQYA